MEFEAKINTWSEPEKFIAREIYDLKRRCPACNYKNKATSFVLPGGIGLSSATLGVVIYKAMERLLGG